MWMFMLFATVTFGLALTGLLSIVGLDVAERRQEFAIRMALGASRRAILGVAIGRTLWRVALGVSAGVFLAALAARGIRSLLFQVAPSDIATFAVVVLLVMLVTTIAAYIPGRRASRREVNTLLRHF
jgi:ABC-type antimicrobial peptide transport system permease subunit